MKVLVTIGPEFTNETPIDFLMANLNPRVDIVTRDGEEDGDGIVDRLAKKYGIAQRTYPIGFTTESELWFGSPGRSKLIFGRERPDLVVAFFRYAREGRAVRNMIDLAAGNADLCTYIHGVPNRGWTQGLFQLLSELPRLPF